MDKPQEEKTVSIVLSKKELDDVYSALFDCLYADHQYDSLQRKRLCDFLDKLNDLTV